MSKEQNYPTCWDVFQWPETKALLKRLGVDLSQPLTGVVITLGDIDEIPKVTITQFGQDIKDKENGEENSSES